MLIRSVFCCTGLGTDTGRDLVRGEAVPGTGEIADHREEDIHPVILAAAVGEKE